MRKPRPGWFTVLKSYFREILIESTSSAYSGQLEVTFYAGRYMLNTRNATYSYEDRYTSYGTALEVVADRIPACKKILVLGMGLGSVPWILQKKYGYRGEITCVDIDPIILQLATDYYPDAELLKFLHLVEADAATWVPAQQGSFDLITVDLFIDRNVPKTLHSREFLAALKSRLAPDGTLLFSRLKDEKQDEDELWANLSSIFPDSSDIDTGGNVILCFRQDV
ncbi:MAG: fused MFS/spermidine synthase [Chitinophagales bacterium]